MSALNDAVQSLTEAMEALEARLADRLQTLGGVQADETAIALAADARRDIDLAADTIASAIRDLNGLLAPAHLPPVRRG